jgi:hypothetical protein
VQLQGLLAVGQGLLVVACLGQFPGQRVQGADLAARMFGLLEHVQGAPVEVEALRMATLGMPQHGQVVVDEALVDQVADFVEQALGVVEVLVGPFMLAKQRGGVSNAAMGGGPGGQVAGPFGGS